MKQTLQILSFIFLFSYNLLAQSNPEQVQSAYEVIISPNPVEDRATFKINQGSHNLTEIKIYDLIGKEVHTVPINSGNGLYTVDLSGLRPGVYFCTVFSDKGVIETRKLVRSNR